MIKRKEKGLPAYMTIYPIGPADHNLPKIPSFDLIVLESAQKIVHTLKHLRLLDVKDTAIQSNEGFDRNVTVLFGSSLDD
ncbi:MAG: hypothetical protein KGJ02_00855 [Verrucomicrobiota bacterium]|nr:hypothetical protein [Verrucomicrobiota bacterium]